MKRVVFAAFIAIVLAASSAPGVLLAEDPIDVSEAGECLDDGSEVSGAEKLCDDLHRKVIFILGINSQGLTKAECDDPEASFYSAYRNNLRDALTLTPVEDEDIIWLSYGDDEDDAYCDQDTNMWPRYEKADTCDGVTIAAEELDRLIRKFRDASFDIVGHSIGGLVAAYWATGGTDEDEWLSDDASLLTERVHSIITLDSPLRGTEFFGFRFYQTVWDCEPPDSTIENYFGQHVASADCAIEGDQTLEDITGCNDGWGIVDTIFSSPPTQHVGFVHINSTLVGDVSQLPGYWRASPPPCRPWLFGQSFDPISFIWSWAGGAHICMLQDAAELHGVADVIMANRFEDSLPATASGPSHEIY